MEKEEGSKAAVVAAESSQKRTSERTRGKRVCYNEMVISKTEQNPQKKRPRSNQKVPKPRAASPVKAVEVVESNSGGEVENVRDSVRGLEGGTGLVGLGLRLEEVRNGSIASRSEVEKSDHYKVKEALRTFNQHYLHLIQEEEKRCKLIGSENNKAAATPGENTKSKRPDLKAMKKKAAATPGEKKKSQRPDLKAVTKMMKAEQILYPTKQFGSIRGVDVGHQFFSRAEMVIVGFHQHWLNGIDFMSKAPKGIVEYSNYTFPLAVSIILSGQYEDDLDNSEDVVYTGQGGHNLLGNKKQMKDQLMLRGNLALKNSIKEGLPVRVVRGHVSKSSYVGKVYTYDGLYKVVNYWAEKGVSGFTVFKFRLKRLDGQPVLTTNQVHFIGGRAPQSLSEVRGLVCNDISGGLEEIPIPATNLVDEPPVPPTGFKYCKSIQVTDSVKIPDPTIGCGCVGGCVDPRVCACARLNNSDFPYVHRDGGRLVEAKAVVFECGPKCSCGPSCVNRTSQKGLRYRFEVFRTPKKGWGVRSWDFIPSGAPVCEYVGVLRRSDEVDSVSENYFIFDIDCLQTMKGLDGRQMRLRDVSMPPSSLLDETESVVDNQPEFCIDAGEKGNLARFINHSCEPNLFVQCVLSSHHDIKLARVVLFAADNIPPLQELTYDYGYALDSVSGPDGKPKQMACYCGAEGCRKRLF